MTYTDIAGWMDFEDFYSAQVAIANDGDVFVEVGCWLGRSTIYLADAIRRSGKQIKLYAVDNFSGVTLAPGAPPEQYCEGRDVRAEFHANLAACGVADLVTVIDSDSADAAALFNPASVDFCFIDADHSYPAVTRDIAAWRPKVKPGGIISGRDRSIEGVDRAVREAFGEYEAVGPSSWRVRL